ncbi:transporter [Haloparvum sp. PAK95]|uniref:transporter n=1 Tax=Haloparvum sp. PAK95 TaxID=3418962 RepID=UPI003D2ED766
MPALRDRIAPGVVAGIVAYALGYLVTYVSQGDAVEEQLRGFNFLADLFGGEPVPIWQGVGWLFYNAHLVRTRIPGLGGPRSENFIAAGDDGTLTLLYFVPVLALFAAGFAVARLAGSADDATDPTTGAVDGAAVVLGYLPLAVVGLLVFSYAVGDGAIEPDPITGVALAGILYPVVCGGLGGAVAAVAADLGGE